MESVLERADDVQGEGVALLVGREQRILAAVAGDEQLAQFDQSADLLGVLRGPHRLDDAISVGLVDHLNADRAGPIGLLPHEHPPILRAGHPIPKPAPVKTMTYDVIQRECRSQAELAPERKIEILELQLMGYLFAIHPWAPGARGLRPWA
jgi:hypothetical protein